MTCDYTFESGVGCKLMREHIGSHLSPFPRPEDSLSPTWLVVVTFFDGSQATITGEVDTRDAARFLARRLSESGLGAYVVKSKSWWAA